MDYVVLCDFAIDGVASEASIRRGLCSDIDYAPAIAGATCGPSAPIPTRPTMIRLLRRLPCPPARVAQPSHPMPTFTACHARRQNTCALATLDARRIGSMLRELEVPVHPPGCGQHVKALTEPFEHPCAHPRTRRDSHPFQLETCEAPAGTRAVVAQAPLLTQQFFTRASPAAGRNVEWAAIKSFEYVQSSGGLTKTSGQSITGTATSDGHGMATR